MEDKEPKKNLSYEDDILDRMSKNLFWDIDSDKINLNSCPAQIIHRVLENGEWNDWCLIREYYGLDKIVEECKHFRTLDPKALSFICALSHTNKNDYRCYHIAQSNPTLWNF